MSHRIGIVTIGRNEGERLEKCLRSVIGGAATVVYVDSASTDGSVAFAREIGAEVVELDMSIRFTAARARNEGLTRLLAKDPECEFVQFVDGDCEVMPGWLEAAAEKLASNPKIAVVCGKKAERYPEASIYNRLCGMEWKLPTGKILFSGGDMMARVAALKEVNGYNSGLIAGEEPEMCLRLRNAGWEIWGIDVPMSIHDADMHRFSQWWMRNVRAGHAFAEVASMHSHEPERFWSKDVRSNWIWGVILPVILVVLIIMPSPWHWTHWAGALGFVLYLKPFWGTYKWTLAQPGNSRMDAFLNSCFILLGKVPQVLGQWKVLCDRVLNRRSRVLEYKGPDFSPATSAVTADR
jgi:glycosyltransferase involved in cell wall biosynthesis